MDPSNTSAAFRSPVLDGSNYALWKVKMRMYIKSIEERAWQRVLDGWSPPKLVDVVGDSRVKPENVWTNDKVQTSNFNSKALNAILTSVDVNMFSLITNCISAKEAWDILQKHCEGSESVSRTKLRMLTSKFESLRMEENETIVEYDRRLRDIANEAFSLGDPMLNERLVSKVLRSPPERFNIKIFAIDESKDTSALNLEDLISSLRTFEMNPDLQKRNKGKAVALQTTDDSIDNLIQEAYESDLGEESISLITKKFGDCLKRMKDKKKTMSTPKPSLVPFEKNKMSTPSQENFKPKNEVMSRLETKRMDSVQCRECSGYGHYANECANRLRKNKNIAVTLSDEDSDEDLESSKGEEFTSLSTILKNTHQLQVNPLGVATGVATPGRNTASKVVCLNAKSLENSKLDEIQGSYQEELTVEIAQMMYEELYDDWLKRNETNSMLSKENTKLKSNLSRLVVLLSRKDLELCKVKDDLQKASKTLAKYNSSSSKLATMLTMGKDGKIGLGYIESIYEHGESSNSGPKSIVFVKGSEDCTVLFTENSPMETRSVSKAVSEQKPKQTSFSSSPSKVHSSVKMPQFKKSVKPKQRNHHFICHYCHKHGHIKPFCYKQRNDYLNWHSNRVLHKVFPNTAVKNSSTRKIWVPKTVIRCNVIYTSLRTNIAGAWYFDSGCSRHMTGTKAYLTDYVEVKSGRATYGGGVKGRIVGKGTLNVDGLPELHNVLHVEGLNSNLISISQLCDDDLHAKFNKNNSEVYNKADMCVMSGARSADNCYQLGEGDECRSAKVSDLDLWHQKLGHVSFKTLKNLCKFDAMKDLTGKTKEDDTEGLADVSEPQTRNGVEAGVETSEATPSTTPTETLENEDSDDGVNSEGKDIPNKIQKNHPSSQIIGEVHNEVRTRKKYKVDHRKMIGLVCMSSTFSQNKTDEFGNIIRNKARLVAQGYTQVEGVDFDETFAPVTRIESVRLLLTVACHMRIKLYQIDVKSAFLNGILNEEAYVSQPKEFEYPHHMEHVYKLKKALYGLKQAPRAWYGRLADYLINLGFKRGEVDKTFFIQKLKHDILICQVYVDYIIFGASSQKLVDNFVECMSSQFEMSMVGELNFFLGLQVTQLQDGIFLCQSKYAKNLVKKFSNDNSKHMKTPMESSEKLSKDDVADGVDNTMYRSIIGNLLYLTATRPDIMFSVFVC
ncbi:uncharacterized protein [Primulina huaijiensis]|uniref:uncharacterized protein n=1 Tax=Primulina huaijiensis TaxID=1492673 RepID=UPI003CC79116